MLRLGGGRLLQKKMHKIKRELEEGEKRVNRHVIN